MILKVLGGECKFPLGSQSWSLQHLPIISRKARAVAPHAQVRFGISSKSSDQQPRKARVIRDLAPLRENYLTRPSPTNAGLLPLSINKLPLFHQLLPPARRDISRPLPHINLHVFSPTTPSIKMTGGGKSGGKASGSKNAQS